MNKPPFIFEGTELLASALHAQLLARRRGTFEHDIKNVLHGLMSGTELLDKALTTSSPRIAPAECVRLLQQQLVRVQATLDRMLEEVTPAETERKDLDLSALLEECNHDLRHDLQRLELRVEIEPGLIVRAQRSRVKDALLSMLFEGIDAAPPRSALTLRAVRRSEREVRVELQHALLRSTESKTLEIVAAVLKEQEIGLEVVFNGLERRIEMSLPPVSMTPQQDVNPRRVLVVDANRDAADSSAMLIGLEGYEATAAYDIQTALQQGRALGAGVVLVDVDGSVDSETLVRRLRGEMPHARIIGLSHASEPRTSSIEVHLRKPLEAAALRAILSQE